MSIRLLSSAIIAGAVVDVDGAVLSLDAGLESVLVGQGRAEWVNAPAIDTDDRSLLRALTRAGAILPPSTTVDNYLTKAFSILDDMSAAATAWNNSKSGCTISDDTTIVRAENGADNALKVAVSSTYVRFQRTFASPVVMSGTINVWVYFDSDPTAGMTFEVYFSSDYANFATKYFKWYFPGDTYLRKGWNCLSLNTEEDGTTTGATITSGGSESWANAMNGCKIIANGLATGQTFRIGGIFYGGEARANVLFSFDDAYSSLWTVFNLFRRHGVPASVAVITGKVGTAGYLSLHQLTEIYKWGWDIIPHSVTHPVGGFAAKTAEETYAELNQSRQWCERNGFDRTSDIFAWPQNAYASSVNVDLIGLAKAAGFRLSRGSTRRDLPTAQGIDNPMRLPSADVGGKTLAQVKKLLDAAERYKQTNIIYAHKSVGTASSPASGGAAPADTLEWYLADFIALAADIAARATAGTLKSITYSDLLTRCRVA